MRAFLPLILIMLSAAVVADTVVPSDAVESYVNIRSAPEASAEAVGRLHRSKPRPHVQTLDGWYEVELDNEATGFVSSDWSMLVTEEPAAPESEAAAEAVEPTLEEPSPPDVQAKVPMPEAGGEEPVPDVDEEPTPPEVVDETPPEPVVDAGRAAAETTRDEKAPVARKSADADTTAVAAGAAASPAIGPRGPAGPPGPPGRDGAIKGKENFLVKFKKPTVGGNSQIYDDGNRVGIGTVEPEQRLEINGSLQIHDQTSAVAGVMITQIRGETGYILHNQASTLTIGAGSVDRITIDKDGNIGFGVNRPEHPLQLANGAYVTAGGAWTNSSSRSRKENIERLSVEEALEALAGLEPVEFNYLGDADERYVGFIAEDVPGLVAMQDRKSLSSMDIVAVLTRVVQQQQAQIRALEQRLDRQERSDDSAAGSLE